MTDEVEVKPTTAQSQVFLEILFVIFLSVYHSGLNVLVTHTIKSFYVAINFTFSPLFHHFPIVFLYLFDLCISSTLYVRIILRLFVSLTSFSICLHLIVYLSFLLHLDDSLFPTFLSLISVWTDLFFSWYETLDITGKIHETNTRLNYTTRIQATNVRRFGRLFTWEQSLLTWSHLWISLLKRLILWGQSLRETIISSMETLGIYIFFLEQI